jgi:hypothetical protein
MRQALGLEKRPAGPHQAAAPQSHDPSRQRRRFAQDGEVPVVMLHRSREGDAGGENKLAALSAELREERLARGKAERALEEAHLTIQSLQTKIAHTEMTYTERLSAERQLRLQAEAAAAELAQRPVQVAEPPKAVVQETPAPQLALPIDEAEGRTVESPAPKSPPATKRAAKPKAAPDVISEGEEAQPIEWWLPSFRAGRKAPTRKRAAAKTEA